MDVANGLGYNFIHEENPRRSKRIQRRQANQGNEVLPRAQKGKKRSRKKTKAKPRINRPHQNTTMMSLQCCTEKTCLLNYGRVIIALIRKDFDSKLYECQNNYLSSLIDVDPKAKRNRIIYNIRDMSGLRKVKVCKTAFLKIFGIGKKRVMVLISKIQPYSGDIEKDQRGVNRNQKRIPLASKTEVIEHIRSYDRELSHYARERTRDKQFLASNLTIMQLWLDFLTKKGLQVGDKLPLCYSTFREIFRTFNLSFQKPYVDTCVKCDSLSIIVKHSTDEEERKSAQELHDDHLDKADKHYDGIHYDLNVLPKIKVEENGSPWILPPTWN